MILDRKQSLLKILADKSQELEARDNEILKTREKKYIPAKIQKRTLITEFGQLHFKRRIYKYYNNDLKKWCYICLLDQELNIKKWSKLDDALIEQVTKQLWKGKRYQDIVDMFPEAQISLMSISRIFKRIDYRKFIDHNIPKIKLNQGQRVYINMDDTFPKVWKKNKKVELKVRVISFNLGFDKKKTSIKRRVLKSKRYCFILGKAKGNAQAVAKEIIKQGKKFFEGFNSANLVVGGDGANWIQHVAYELKTDYVLDKYHALKYLKTVFNINYHNPKRNLINWKLYKTCVVYFECGRFFDLISVLQEYATKEVINYFKHNRRGVQNFGEPWNIGVSAESDVSKLVKSTLGYGSKIYSLGVFKNILYNRTYIFNRSV